LPCSSRSSEQTAFPFLTMRTSQLLTAVLLTSLISISRAESAVDTNTLYANPKSLVLGYLWADGSGSGEKWHFRNRNKAITDRFAAAAHVCGCEVIRRVNKDFHAAQISGVVFDMPLDRLPFDLAQASDAEIKSFCAAVIEGEGNHDGLVLDDPDRKHAEAMAAALGRLHLKTRLEGTKFFRLYAEKECWPVIQSFPFVAYGRVPGGKRGGK